MKKFILSIISILSIICIAFGMAGCANNNTVGNKKEENKNQDQPIINSESQREEVWELFSNIQSATFTYFYENNLGAGNDKLFYLLNIDVKNTSYGYPTYVLLNGNDAYDKASPKYNIAASELANIYVDEFGTGMNFNGETGIPYYTFSLYLNFYFLPFDYIKGSDFRIEFTEYSESVNLEYKLKIFEGDILIAEGTYDETVAITKEWLENYIKDNLK